MDKNTCKSSLIPGVWLVIVAIIVIVAMVGLLMLRPAPLMLQGEVQVSEVRVSGKLPGRVVAFDVSEGDSVDVGDTLVHIHSSLFEAQLSSAYAMQEVAAAENALVDAGTRHEVVQSFYQLLLQAEATLSIATKTYERMESLYAKGVVSEQRRDEAQAAYLTAQAAVETARLQYEMAGKGARLEQKEAASAMVKVAESGVAEVEAVLEDAYLTATHRGVISDIFPQEGELVSLGAPIMNILLMDDVWVSFNVREDFLKYFALNKMIDVVVPALNNKRVTLKIFHIKDKGVYAVWRATKVSSGYDAKTFNIKARPIEPVDGLLPGMTVLLKNVERDNQ
ncbi:MAG: efflux RND transporter periplasmic adaptor subunit [Bacteroidaceae bacterium]|nr:efflux RND transporter periplasmic adaptor subunit [Bacteroidaceae bacterium]